MSTSFLDHGPPPTHTTTTKPEPYYPTPYTLACRKEVVREYTSFLDRSWTMPPLPPPGAGRKAATAARPKKAAAAVAVAVGGMMLARRGCPDLHYQARPWALTLALTLSPGTDPSPDPGPWP